MWLEDDNLRKSSCWGSQKTGVSNFVKSYGNTGILSHVFRISSHFCLFKMNFLRILPLQITIFHHHDVDRRRFSLVVQAAETGELQAVLNEVRSQAGGLLDVRKEGYKFKRKLPPKTGIITFHRIHVWYICQHLPYKTAKCR